MTTLRFVSISEIPALGVGEKIPSIRCKVTKVYKRTTGSSNDGPWSFQNIELSDSTGTIKAKLKNRDEMPESFKGKELVFACTPTQQHGLNGVKREDNDYNGKKTPIVVITKAAEMTEVSGSHTPQQQQSQPQTQQPAAQTQPAQHQNGNGHSNGNGQANGNGSDAAQKRELAAKMWLKKRKNAHLHALSEVESVKRDWEAGGDNEGRVMSMEHFEASVTSTVIAMEKAGIIDDLPPWKPEPWGSKKPAAATTGAQ